MTLKDDVRATIETMRPGAVFTVQDVLIFGRLDGWSPQDVPRGKLTRIIDQCADRVPKRYGAHDWTTWRRTQ